MRPRSRTKFGLWASGEGSFRDAHGFERGGRQSGPKRSNLDAHFGERGRLGVRIRWVWVDLKRIVQLFHLRSVFVAKMSRFPFSFHLTRFDWVQTWKSHWKSKREFRPASGKCPAHSHWKQQNPKGFTRAIPDDWLTRRESRAVKQRKL